MTARPGAAGIVVRLTVVAMASLLAACSGPILANPPAARPPAPPPTVTPPPPADPLPIVLPADDGPHRRLTEWWYYTGHLEAADGSRFGFEYVVFRAERGAFPVTWASHLALTDETGGRFHYAQRSEIGARVDRSPAAGGFSFALVGGDPERPETLTVPAWEMAGGDGIDLLRARLSAAEAAASGAVGGLGIDLRLHSEKPPTLHDRDGWIDFGPAGGSYYYSRTRMRVDGEIDVGGRSVAVRGLAWFDHQWGDFIAVGGGGWDWFAVNLDDGSDLTLSLVRDADGSHPLVYGTFVDAAGRARHLERDAFTVDVTARWVSPHTGADYPAGWRIDVPGESLVVRLIPTVADQELDTRASTGVVYWEGSQRVEAVRDGRSMGGEAYVELTGYAGRGE